MHRAPYITENRFVGKSFFRHCRLSVSFIKFHFNAVRQACVFFRFCSYRVAARKGLYYTKLSLFKAFQLCCSYEVAAEQKARTTYDNILRMVDDPDVIDPIRYLRAREVVHFQRFGEALRVVQDNLDCKNFYAINPEFDK